MAMIKCTECGKDMSDKANVCPNCGCPIEEIREKLGEIESEREKKIRVKEEEKKRKEVEAEAKKQRKEAAKKALTPAEKRKRVVTGVFALILVYSGEFAYRCCLSHAVDTYNKDNSLLIFEIIGFIARPHLLSDIFHKEFLALGRIGNMLFLYLLAQIINDTACSIDTDISHNESFFKLLIKIIVYI